MTGDFHGQTLIAGLTVLGTFVIIIISELTDRPLDPSTQVLVGSALTGVIGWYFGVRGHAAGAESATANVATAVEAIQSVTPHQHSGDTEHSAGAHATGP